MECEGGGVIVGGATGGRGLVRVTDVKNWKT